MAYNFKNEVTKMHKKEVQDFHKELTENNEPYYNQVKNDGYDNLHDYESNITSRLIKHILITLIFLFIFIVWYLFFS